MNLSTDPVIEVSSLEPPDIASWAAFLPTARVGGSLPVTFRAKARSWWPNSSCPT